MPAAPEFPLVGRDDDLAHLLTARREATGNGPRFVLLLGDAGTGKTRLVDELAARGPETELVVGRAVDYASTPYAPIAELWRQLDAFEPTVLAKHPALRRALGEFAARAAPAGGSGEDPADGRRAAFDGAVEALRFYGARRPFTLVLEDAQWSDLASLELLHHVALVGHDAPVLFVITAREGGLDESRAKMLDRLARLPRVARVRLEVLEPAAAAAVVDEELRRSRRSLGAAERRAILTAADGNPLYLRELTRHYASRSATGDALPGSLTASVRVRLRAAGRRAARRARGLGLGRVRRGAARARRRRLAGGGFRGAASRARPGSGRVAGRRVARHDVSPRADSPNRVRGRTAGRAPPAPSCDGRASRGRAAPRSGLFAPRAACVLERRP
ncbi:MAG TPA: AAA family ATPase [Candidatus Elarobacter sp.]|nr:AAA family ATPase [Candidatus Elarobacter sp.]